MGAMSIEQCAKELDAMAREIGELGRAEYEKHILSYGYERIKESTAAGQSPSGKKWAPKLDGQPAGVTISASIILTAGSVRSVKPHAIFFHSRRKLTKSSIGVKFGKKYRAKKVSIRTKVGGSRPIMPGFKFPRQWNLDNPVLKSIKKAMKHTGKYIF